MKGESASEKSLITKERFYVELTSLKAVCALITVNVIYQLLGSASESFCASFSSLFSLFSPTLGLGV